MTINQILAEQMKEFEKEFSNGGKGKQWDGYWEDVDMFISTVKIEDVKAFIHSYTRKLIESVAEEIIDEITGYDDDVSIVTIEGLVRLKVKEIINSISK